MKLLGSILLLSSVALVAHGYTCPAGKSKKVIKLGMDQSEDLETQEGDKYGKNVNCKVIFKKKNKKLKCNLEFSCDDFALIAKKPTCKGGSDFFVINRKKYCGENSPEVETTKMNLAVLFKSNKKSKGDAGAICTATCVSEAATTAAPITAAPTTAAPTTAGCPSPTLGEYLPAGNNAASSFSSSGPSDCSARCSSTPSCVAWTLMVSSNTCWLKTSSEGPGPSEDFMWGLPCSGGSGVTTGTTTATTTGPTTATTTGPTTPKPDCCTTCSTDFTATPPFHGTVHAMPNTIIESDPTTFTAVTFTGTATPTSMWGPTGWSSNIPVYQFKADFSDSQSVTVNCDQDVGTKATCLQYAEKFSRSLGRVPWFSRWATRGLDLRPGTYGAPSGCNAWGGGGVITMCAGVGDTLMQAGNFEELMLHEGAHVTLDSEVLHSDAWKCARDMDKNYISQYAKDRPTSEDVTESVVPWYAWTYSKDRVAQDTITKITDSIPNRLSLFTELFASERLVHAIERRLNATSLMRVGEDSVEPHVIGGERQV